MAATAHGSHFDPADRASPPSHDGALLSPSLRGATCPPKLNERRRKRRRNPCFSKRRYGLLRFARNDDLTRKERRNGPTGKSAKICPALAEEIFRLARRANQRYQLARL